MMEKITCRTALAATRVSAQGFPTNVISLAPYRAARFASQDSERRGFYAALIKPASEWHRAFHQMELARLTALTADQYRFCMGIEYGLIASETEQARTAAKRANQNWQCARLEQLFIAAPAVRHLRWKEKEAARWPFHPEIEAALARDREAHSLTIERAFCKAAARKTNCSSRRGQS